MIKKIIIHTFLYGFGPRVPQIVNLFILPVITPYLTTTDYGIQGVIAAYTGILNGLAELGLTVVLVNTFYEYNKGNKWKFHWQRLFGFLLLWSIIYSFLLGLIVYMVMPDEAYSNRNIIVLIIVAKTALFSTIIVLGSRLYQLMEKPHYITCSVITSGLVTVAANVYFIKILKLGYMGWYYSALLGTITTFLFYSVPLLKKYKLIPSFNFNKRFITSHLKVALPTVPHNYSAYLLNSSDRIVLERLNAPISEIGVYNVAYNFGTYFMLIGQATGLAISPMMAKMWFKKKEGIKEKLRDLLFLLQIVFITMGFLLALWSKDVLPLLFRNSTFSEADKYAGIIILSYVYFPMYWAWGAKLYYIKKTKNLWKISFVAGVLNIILNLIFYPIYGIMATVVSTFICMMYLGFAGFYLKAYKAINDVKYYPMLWLLLICAVTIIYYVTKNINLYSKVLISLIFLLIILIVLISNKNKLKALNE